MQPPGHGSIGDGSSSSRETLGGPSPPTTATEIPPMPPQDRSNRQHEPHTVQTRYHPSAKLPTRYETLEEYQQRRDQEPTADKLSANESNNSTGWHPFNTYADFRLSEIALQNTLPKRVITELIELVSDVQEGKDTFTLRSYSSLDNVWKAATPGLTGFIQKNFTKPFAGVDLEFTMSYRSPWDWAIDLAKDPILAPHFQWDAVSMSKFDGEKWERFVNEPWTGEDFFEFQTGLNDPDGKVLSIILYSDKTVLSPFGKQTAWPVYARIGNLPTHIRNGTGLGGGRVVGWLPIVDDDPEHKGKPGWVDFKRVIWHEAWAVLMEKLKDNVAVGVSVQCGDGVVRTLYPRIFILCADYEEQCFMAGIHGGNKADKPCPVCLIDRDNMGDYIPECPLRTREDSRSLVREAMAQPTEAARNRVLKDTGLRCLENAFWPICDPYPRLSWDRLHSYPGGLARHLFNEIVDEHVKKCDEPWMVTKWVEDCAKAFPRWSGLIHFSHFLTDYSYQDSNKWEDMARIVPFIMHDVFPKSNLAFRQLLRAHRHFLVLNAYSSFENYTESQLDDIATALKDFASEIKKYASLQPSSKIWSFPKLHTHMHMIHDIVAKGATRNFNTKPNESMHKLLKMWYRFLSNFRDLDQPFFEFEHRCHLTTHIRARIDAQKHEKELEVKEREMIGLGVKKAQEGDQPDKPRRVRPKATKEWGHVSFGSPGKKIMWRDLTAHVVANQIEFVRDDMPTFDFRAALERFLQDPENVLSIQEVCPGLSTTLTSQTTIEDFHLMRALYESLETWEWEQNTLRCSPKFYGAPRYDSVMINTDGRPYFARLLHLFTVANSKNPELERIPLALILPYDGTVPPRTVADDRFLGLHRVQTRRNAVPEIIFARAILRGSLLVPVNIPTSAEDTYSYSSDHFVFDIADSDMFLRMKELVDS